MPMAYQDTTAEQEGEGNEFLTLWRQNSPQMSQNQPEDTEEFNTTSAPLHSVEQKVHLIENVDVKTEH